MIDLLDPRTFAGGHPRRLYDDLRRTAPVYRHPEPAGPGFWALTRYQDVSAVARDYATFSSHPTVMIADSGAVDEGPLGEAQMLMMDPPRHTAYRNLTHDLLTRRAALGRTSRIAQLARMVINGVIERGECDFVADIGGEMIAYLMAELIGLPPGDGRQLYALTETIQSDPAEVGARTIETAFETLYDYGARLIAHKRAHPGDDLATRILTGEVEGRRLTESDFMLYFLLLLDAGGDTTRHLLPGALVALAAHPDQWAWLMADLDTRMARAREELLRYTSPVIYMRRTATRAARIGDTAIAKGDKVVMYFGAANNDPAKFAHPDRLDLARHPNPQISFGRGPHVCVGQHMARLEIDALFTEALTRLKGLEIIGEPPWLPSNFVCGPQRLHVRFTPGAPL